MPLHLDSAKQRSYASIAERSTVTDQCALRRSRQETRNRYNEVDGVRRNGGRAAMTRNAPLGDKVESQSGAYTAAFKGITLRMLA
jgi:hypothetical protein